MPDYPDNIRFFNKNPSFEKYIQLRHFIDPKIKSKKYKNKLHYTLFLHVIHLKYPTYEENYRSSFLTRLKSCFSTEKYVSNEDCNSVYRHIMGDPTLLCMTDIDLLWLCFYGTGDPMYPNQVKLCALTKKQAFIADAVVKTAAEWSYNNHVLQNFINGPTLSQNVVTSTITDPLFFYPDPEAIMDKYRDE